MTIHSVYNRIMQQFGYSYRYGAVRKMYRANTDPDTYCGKPLYKENDGNQVIARKLIENKPFLVARLGSTELSAIYHYYLNGVRNIKWDPTIFYNMQIASGFFPADAQHIERFCEEFFAHLHNVDVMGAWFVEGEEQICTHYCPDATMIDLKCIEPYYYLNDPWSRHLAGKKVLVIHPFEASVREQYEQKRTKLFPNQLVLPDFELKTIKAVQSIAGTKPDFDTWFDAYHHMCDQILSTDFDIAIIGAGAYGLPLGSFVKTIGKQAIHMGGATQILFGVSGKRWESIPDISKLFNENWKKPYPYETPKSAEKVENACYW